MKRTNESLTGALIGAKLGARLGRFAGPEGLLMGMAIGGVLGNRQSKPSKTKMTVYERPIQEMRGRSRATINPKHVYQGSTSKSAEQGLMDLDAELARVLKPKPKPKETVKKIKISEARGRPRKETNSEIDEHDRHIIMQLRKAITIGKPVTFASGEKKLVSGRVAKQVLQMHDRLRTTTEKARFENTIKQSYIDLVDVLGC